MLLKNISILNNKNSYYNNEKEKYKLKKETKTPWKEGEKKHLFLKVKYNFLSNASTMQKSQADTSLLYQFSSYLNAYFFIRPTFFLFSYFLNQNRGKMYYTFLNFLKQNRRQPFLECGISKNSLSGAISTQSCCTSLHTHCFAFRVSFPSFIPELLVTSHYGVCLQRLITSWLDYCKTLLIWQET